MLLLFKVVWVVVCESVLVLVVCGWGCCCFKRFPLLFFEACGLLFLWEDWLFLCKEGWVVVFDQGGLGCCCCSRRLRLLTFRRTGAVDD